MSQDGHQRGHVLQLEEEIWWSRCYLTLEAEEPGGGERTVEEIGYLPESGQTDSAGSAEKKVLRPSQKRGMVENIGMEYNISIQRCCKLVLLHKSVFLLQGQGP